METFIAVVLEIIKITIPALIVFLTVYHLFKQYLEKQYQLKTLEYKQSQTKITIPMKMQAYERLSLFCERISIPSLLLRLRTENQSNAGLRVALLLAIQHEYEHNITQQLYVSNQLWQIIKIARDDSINIINGVAEKVNPQSNSGELAGTLLNYLEQQESLTIDKALLAIKKEVSLLM